MPEGFIAIVAGVLLLFFGKRLFWLAAALVAFLFGWQFFGNLLGPEFTILLSLILGILFAWLSIKFIKTAAYFIAFLAGAIALPFLVGIFGIDMSWFILAGIGGVIGLILVAVAFDWGLILVTAWAGASAITFGIEKWYILDSSMATLVFLTLLVLGIFWQAANRRKIKR
jgi:hypothetical protein